MQKADYSMNRFANFIFLLIFPLNAIADGFSIEAAYSVDGMPISADIEAKIITRLGSQLKLKTESQCLQQLNSVNIIALALGQAAQAGATDVVIKCSKFWNHPNCGATYYGCVGRTDVAQIRHIHLYNNLTRVPKYLMLSNADHQVLQTLAYSENPEMKSGWEVIFAAQEQYDTEKFHKISGEFLTCENAIKNKQFENFFRKNFLGDKKNKNTYKLNCYNVRSDGRSTLVGEKLIRAVGK